jgi:hypothetical protein
MSSTVGTKNFQRFETPWSIRSFTSASPYRLSKNLWSLRKGASEEKAVFTIDLNPEITTRAGKGFRLIGYDVVYAVSGSELAGAPTDALSLNTFVSGLAPTVTSLTVTGAAFSTAALSDGRTYVVHRELQNPRYVNNPTSSLNLELTFPCSTTSVLDLFGVNLWYSKNNK